MSKVPFWGEGGEGRGEGKGRGAFLVISGYALGRLSGVTFKSYHTTSTKQPVDISMGVNITGRKSAGYDLNGTSEGVGRIPTLSFSNSHP